MLPQPTKRLCRTGIIAALYAALTYAFAPFAFGPIQIRPAEALCLLALIYPESILALTVGCALSNLTSPYFIYDVVFGSLATLLAAFVTYMVGRFIKKEGLRLFLGGLAPVLCNALILPLVLVFFCGVDGGNSLLVAYALTACSVALTECIWVYALGAPLYFAVKRIDRS